MALKWSLAHLKDWLYHLLEFALTWDIHFDQKALCVKMTKFTGEFLCAGMDNDTLDIAFKFGIVCESWVEVRMLIGESGNIYWRPCFFWAVCLQVLAGAE